VLEDVINNSAGYPNTVHLGSAVLARRGEGALRTVGSIPLKWVAAPAAGALLTPLALVGPTAGAASPTGTPG
jgi:hypothetical protein